MNALKPKPQIEFTDVLQSINGDMNDLMRYYDIKKQFPYIDDGLCKAMSIKDVDTEAIRKEEEQKMNALLHDFYPSTKKVNENRRVLFERYFSDIDNTLQLEFERIEIEDELPLTEKVRNILLKYYYVDDINKILFLLNNFKDLCSNLIKTYGNHKTLLKLNALFPNDFDATNSNDIWLVLRYLKELIHYLDNIEDMIDCRCGETILRFNRSLHEKDKSHQIKLKTLDMALNQHYTVEYIEDGETAVIDDGVEETKSKQD